jgi:hypothetical protein
MRLLLRQDNDFGNSIESRPVDRQAGSRNRRKPRSRRGDEPEVFFARKTAPYVGGYHFLSHPVDPGEAQTCIGAPLSATVIFVASVG